MILREHSHAVNAEARSFYYPRQAGAIDSYPLDDDLAVYNQDDCDAYTMNETRLFIWKHCDGVHSVEDIAGALAAHYGIGIQRGLAEARVFLADLERASLLEWHDGDEDGRVRRAEEGRAAREALSFLAVTQGEQGNS